MALKRLVNTHELKLTLLEEKARSTRLDPVIRYDALFDALTLLLVQPAVEPTVHYLADDDYVALLYDHTINEIVGLQIERFKRSFLPQHDALRQAWSTDDQPQLSEFDDLIAAFTSRRNKIAKRMIEANEDLFGEHQADILAGIKETA
jgi:hypothetical protein